MILIPEMRRAFKLGRAPRIRAGSRLACEPVLTQMARRKFRGNQRHEPTAERSFQEYVFNAPAPQTSRMELLRLARGGEDTFLELKVKLSNPERIAQEIVALANTGGGTIVFGVNDNLRVEGVDDAEEVRDELVRICRDEVVPSLVPYIDLIAFDSGRRIVSLDVEGKRRPYQTTDGRYYVRLGADKREATREELSELLDEARPLRYENVALRGASAADIDEAHLWSFVREFEGDAFEPNSVTKDYPTGDVLKRELLLAAGSMDLVVPTVAGLLLFGRDERVRELLPRAGVTAIRYAGDTTQASEIERVQLEGNLHTLYESALRFAARYCDLWDKRPQPRAAAGEDALALDRPAAGVGEVVQLQVLREAVRRLAVRREPRARIALEPLPAEV